MNLISQPDMTLRVDVAETQQNANLAAQLVMTLRTQQQRNGAWPGRDLGHILRYTCHALEALQLLGDASLPRVLDNGVHWLLNLADEIEENSSAWITVRLHPSRFKTLARLRRFQDEKLLEDFAELCTRIGEDGLLSKVLEDQLLGSLIVMDCLLELRNAGQDTPMYNSLAAHTLPAIRTNLQRWCSLGQSAQRQGLVDNVGEASYALDILLRSGAIQCDDPLCSPVRTAMLDALSPERNQRALEKDALYSAIQLHRYYRDDSEVEQGIRRFHQHLRQCFERGEERRWLKQEDMLPLILRMLLTCGSETISQSLVAGLWEEAFASRQHLDQEHDATRKQRFMQMIRQCVQIDIRGYTELTGGITTARVFRVEYAIQDDILADRSALQRNGVTRVVIKDDDRSSLERSVQQYQRLPADLQRYFARHGAVDQIFNAGGASSMMVLDDLTEEYVTFREVLDEVDKRCPSPDDTERLLKATNAITQCLFDIYERTFRPIDDIAGYQVSRLYLSRMDRSLLDMVSNHRFPRLKDFFRGFTLQTADGAEEHFKSIGYYQHALHRHLHRLRPPCLVTTHGDCHSRNIMLDNYFQRVKFIDLDRIDVAGDYVLDIALLLEDVALFRRFFDEKYRFYLRPDEITLSADRSHIAYPTFVTETAQLFQRTLLAEVAKFAERCQDAYYRERLWLGIALHLLRLVDKQNDIRPAAALYVEAIKLLDVLVDSMNGEQRLPTIPVEPVFVRRTAIAEHLAPIHAIIMRCQAPDSSKITFDLRAAGKVIRYLVGEKETPFAILDGKNSTARLMLACPADELWRTGELAQPINEGKIRAVITLDPAAKDLATLITEIVAIVMSRGLDMI